MTRAAALLLLALAALWPVPGSAARLDDMSPGPPVGTTIDGFNQVMGPSATEPEHFGAFIKPRPVPCPSCPPVAPLPANASPASPPPANAAPQR